MSAAIAFRAPVMTEIFPASFPFFIVCLSFGSFSKVCLSGTSFLRLNWLWLRFYLLAFAQRSARICYEQFGRIEAGKDFNLVAQIAAEFYGTRPNALLRIHDQDFRSRGL